MSRRRLLREVDPEEIAEWMAYDALEPFGPDVADLRAARVSQLIANAFRGEDVRPFTLDDFTFAAKPEPTDADMTDKAKRVFGIST